MSEITSFAALAATRAKLIALPAVSARIAARVAPAFSALAQQSFDSQSSPYGDPWAPGADGQSVDLRKSGRLRSVALRYVAEGTRVRASIGGVSYARYQLKRGLLPKTGAIPSAWNARLIAIANDELAKAMAA